MDYEEVFQKLMEITDYYDEDRERFELCYKGTLYWVGVCVKNEGIKRGIEKALAIMHEMYIKEHKVDEKYAGWIKTIERLPKEGEIVTLYDPHADKMCSGILKSCYANYRGDLRRVYYWDVLLDLDSLVCSGQYTHWRPLPEPPEVEEWNG